METRKNADELVEIMSRQLDILTGEKVTREEVLISEAIANQIGKMIKLATLRIVYLGFKKNGGQIIETLESTKNADALLALDKTTP